MFATNSQTSRLTDFQSLDVWKFQEVPRPSASLLYHGGMRESPTAKGDPPEKDPLDGKLLLTYSEAAKALGLGRTTIYRLVKAGRLKVVHPTPRSARITRESLEAFLRSLEEEAKPEGAGRSVVDRAREVLRRFGL